MPSDADAGREYDPRPQGRTDSRTYAVIDTHTHAQHARGLSKARAEALAREYCDGVVVRRERPDPHWLQRGGSA